jgi:hypothetical protein
MGWLKDYFWDDKPCLIIQKIVIDDEPRPRKMRLVQSSQEAKLIAENRELKKQLQMKRANAIDVDCKLLE